MHAMLYTDRWYQSLTMKNSTPDPSAKELDVVPPFRSLPSEEVA